MEKLDNERTNYGRRQKLTSNKPLNFDAGYHSPTNSQRARQKKPSSRKREVLHENSSAGEDCGEGLKRKNVR